MAELIFTAGKKNAFSVDEEGIRVEFNPCIKEGYAAMAVGLAQTILDFEFGCEQQASDFFRTLPTNAELWTEEGAWAGKPFEKRYEI